MSKRNVALIMSLSLVSDYKDEINVKYAETMHMPVTPNAGHAGGRVNGGFKNNFAYQVFFIMRLVVSPI